MATPKTSDYLLSYAADLTSIREHFTTHDPAFALLPHDAQTTTLHALLSAAHADHLMASSRPHTTGKIMIALNYLATRCRGHFLALDKSLRIFPESVR